MGACAAAAGDQFNWTRKQLASLAGRIEESTAEQRKHTTILTDVNEAVRRSGVHLEEIGLKASDIEEALHRNAHSNIAMNRAMMSIQFFLASVANGNLQSRDAALAALEISFKELEAVKGAAHPLLLLRVTTSQLTNLYLHFP